MDQTYPTCFVVYYYGDIIRFTVTSSNVATFAGVIRAVNNPQWSAISELRMTYSLT
jgi:hypothetical protein